MKQHCIKINGIEVNLIKRGLGHAHGVTTRDTSKEKEYNNSCEDETILEPEVSDFDGAIKYVEEHRTLLSLLTWKYS